MKFVSACDIRESHGLVLASTLAPLTHHHLSHSQQGVCRCQWLFPSLLKGTGLGENCHNLLQFRTLSLSPLMMPCLRELPGLHSYPWEPAPGYSFHNFSMVSWLSGSQIPPCLFPVDIMASTRCSIGTEGGPRLSSANLAMV